MQKVLFLLLVLFCLLPLTFSASTDNSISIWDYLPTFDLQQSNPSASILAPINPILCNVTATYALATLVTSAAIAPAGAVLQIICAATEGAQTHLIIAAVALGTMIVPIVSLASYALNLLMAVALYYKTNGMN